MRVPLAQAAKTYLERKFEVFTSCSADELIGHGLRALSASVTDGELTPENCTVAVVGKGLSLVLLEGDALQPHIDSLKARSYKIVPPGALAVLYAATELPATALHGGCGLLTLDSLRSRLRKRGTTEHQRRQVSSQQLQKPQSQAQRATEERLGTAPHPWRANSVPDCQDSCAVYSINSQAACLFHGACLDTKL